MKTKEWETLLNSRQKTGLVCYYNDMTIWISGYFIELLATAVSLSSS